MIRDVDFHYYRLLKRRIEEKTGIRILDFTDCVRISTIFAEEKINISAHTVARFFGILRENHKPYRSTLNLIATFLGHDSFSSFCQFEDMQLKEYLNGKHYFSTGDFSFTALELAIAESNWKHVRELLAAYQIDYRKQSITDFLGNAVRKHPQRTPFLKALAEIENGLHLFYESFVDEDDPDNYYSDALTSIYLKKKKDLGSTFFVESFLIGKKLYHNEMVSDKAIDKLFHAGIQPGVLHFHQLSRWFELRIILSSRTNQKAAKTLDIIAELLTFLPNFKAYEKRWVLARSLKALIFCDLWSYALQMDALKQEIITCYYEMDRSVSSIADLIIQLCAQDIQHNEGPILPIMKLDEPHLNETNARIAIEAATAFKHAQNPVKQIIQKNIIPFAQRTGNAWVLKMVQ